MPLPGGATGFVLSFGQYGDPSFAGMQGILRLPVARVHVATGAVLQQSWTVTIANDGTGSISDLPFTDDAAFTGTGQPFSMEWQALNYKPTPGNNHAFVVLTASGTTVDYDVIANSDGTITPGVAPQLPLVTSVVGHSGSVTAASIEQAMNDDAGRLSDVALRAASEPLVTGPLPASQVTQGLYQRTIPAPSGAGSGIVALANDPSVAGRIWVLGRDFSNLGFTDDHGATFTSKAAAPVPSLFGLYFAGGFAWALCGPSAAAQGSLWRSPLPDASGNGLSFTKKFDLASPPGGITVGDNATFRNSCVAINGADVYLVEYSVGTITGGPSIYYSADSGATWAKKKTWANAKHAHSVKVIGGVPWVMLGDGGTAFTDIGLWNATNAAAGTWGRRNNFGEAQGGNTLYGINMITMSVGGQPMIVAEYDGSSNYGPIIFPSQSATVARNLLPTFQMPAAYAGTMRQLTLTSEGNLMWVHTGEGGAVGPLDSVVIAKGPHFTEPVVLETLAASGNSFDTLGDPVEDGQYIWLGHHRVRKEKFLGQ